MYHGAFAALSKPSPNIKHFMIVHGVKYDLSPFDLRPTTLTDNPMLTVMVGPHAENQSQQSSGC